jgi:hypothetical protein
MIVTKVGGFTGNENLLLNGDNYNIYSTNTSKITYDNYLNIFINNLTVQGFSSSGRPSTFKIPLNNSSIDIDNYKLKFELIQCTELIKNKITNKQLKLDDVTIKAIYEKIDKINSEINTLSNQKLLDIKNNLTNKFFLN